MIIDTYKWMNTVEFVWTNDKIIGSPLEFNFVFWFTQN